MTKPQKIDLAGKTFVSNGNTYYIDTDSICYDRLVRFLSAIPTLAYGLTIDNMQTHVADILKFLRGQKTNGADEKVNIHTIIFDTTQAVQNLYSTLKMAQDTDFFEATIEQHLDFCTLFVNKEGEDCTVYNKGVMERKKADWKTDMDMYSFFLLAKVQLPRYKEVLQELLHENGGVSQK